MGAFSPLGQTEIANLALQEMGSEPITDIEDTNSNAAKACNAAFWQAVREVGRAHNWGCLKLRKSLTPLAPLAPGDDGSCPIGWPGDAPTTPPAYWLADTAYTGGTLVTWGQAIYYCLQGNTSSNNFLNDVTAGYWAQLYSSFFAQNPGNAGGLYEWNYAYALPPDFLLITELNGNDCRSGRGVGSLYEIYIVQTINADSSISNTPTLFCNTGTADVKYTGFIQDCTVFDPLFVGCVATLLASKISTQIRADDGKMSAELRARYSNDVLPNAKLKDAGQGKDRRYDPTRESNFLRSRYGSTAG